MKKPRLPVNNHSWMHRNPFFDIQPPIYTFQRKERDLSVCDRIHNFFYYENPLMDRVVGLDENGVMIVEPRAKIIVKSKETVYEKCEEKTKIADCVAEMGQYYGDQVQEGKIQSEGAKNQAIRENEQQNMKDQKKEENLIINNQQIARTYQENREKTDTKKQSIHQIQFKGEKLQGAQKAQATIHQDKDSMKNQEEIEIGQQPICASKQKSLVKRPKENNNKTTLTSRKSERISKNEKILAKKIGAQQKLKKLCMKLNLSMEDVKESNQKATHKNTKRISKK